MKISREWLQTFFEKPLPEANELARALTFHAFEIESIDPAPMHGVPGDEILDVKVTPNRGHDCLSYRGIAKEISAILRLPMKDPFTGALMIRIVDDLVELSPGVTAPTGGITVHIEDAALVPRYIAGYIKGVKVGPSPTWLVRRLAAMGQQSINNVVDATNYVMFNLGQPLHAFDAGKLAQKDGFSIGVRKAATGETMRALDEKEYTLNDSMLVIVDEYANDGKGSAIGIAGIKGGMPAAITNETTDVIIEVANFNGPSIRKTAQALRLRTDASARFEQGISPDIAAYAMKEVAELIHEIAHGTLVGFTDMYPKRVEKKTVPVSLAKINRMLGIELAARDVADTFDRLGFSHTTSDDSFNVSVPFERLDIEIPEDLVEEVGRIIGYEKIPAVPLPGIQTTPELNVHFYWTEQIRTWLLQNGFSEIYTSVFAEKGERVVLNKVDGVRPHLRMRLADGLAEALEKNARIKDVLGVSQVRLFEIGTVWSEGKEMLHVGITAEKLKKQPTAKEIAADMLQAFSVEHALEEHASVVEIPLDVFGPIKNEAYPEAPLTETERYESFSRYPFIVRDIALWIPFNATENMPAATAEEVLGLIREHAGSLLVRSFKFDEFTKNNQVSYAFRLVFQSPDRTLFDTDANERMESVYAAVRAQGWEVR